MSKSWKTFIVGVVLAGGLSSVAAADGYEPVGKGFAPPARKWTGFHVGVHGGSTRTNYSTSQNAGSEFCWVGNGGICSISPTSVSTSTSAIATGGVSSTSTSNASIAGGAGSATADGSTMNNANGTMANDSDIAGPAVTAAVGGDEDAINVLAEASGTFGAFADTNTGILAAQSRSRAQGIGGFPDLDTEFAVGLVNAFDLATGDINYSSFSVGGHVGYDHQFHNNIVVGFEVDFTSLMDGNTSRPSSDSFVFEENSDDDTITFRREFRLQTDYIGTARARLGYAMGHFLPYVTGGIAFAKFDGETDYSVRLQVSACCGIAASDEGGEFSKRAWGGVVGGGVAWMIGENAVLSGEGLYYKFDETVNMRTHRFDVNGTTDDRVELDDIFEGRMKLSIMLN